MIIAKEVIDYMELLAPPQLAEKWDNTGLMLGSVEIEVKGIITCLDVTTPVVEEALKSGANMIISHHPVIFDGLRNINTDTPKGRMLQTLLKHNITVYSAHTNLDTAINGLNIHLAQKMNLKDVRGLIPYGPAGGGYFLGHFGSLEKAVTLNEYIRILKEQLNIENLRVVGGVEGHIEKVALFSGSFDKEVIQPVLRSGAQVLVTGDVKHHAALDIRELGMCVIDAGHYATERFAGEMLSNMLKDKFSMLDISCNTVEEDPIRYA